MRRGVKIIEVYWNWLNCHPKGFVQFFYFSFSEVQCFLSFRMILLLCPKTIFFSFRQQHFVIIVVLTIDMAQQNVDNNTNTNTFVTWQQRRWRQRYALKSSTIIDRIKSAVISFFIILWHHVSAIKKCQLKCLIDNCFRWSRHLNLLVTLIRCQALDRSFDRRCSHSRSWLSWNFNAVKRNIKMFLNR